MMIKYLFLPMILIPSLVLAAETLADITGTGLKVAPKVAVNYKYDNNIANSNDNQRASNLIEVIPELNLIGERGSSQFALAYKLEQGLYAEDSDSNYTDHTLKAYLNSDINNRNNINFMYQFGIAHDDANTGIAEGNENITEPSVYYTNNVALSYTYGTAAASARIKPNIGFNNKYYDEDNLDYSDVADFSEYNYGITFYYAAAATLDVLFEVSNTSSSYDNASNPLDNDDILAYTGITWDISGKTQGTAKVGYEKVNYANASRDDISAPSWDIGLGWSPKTYSTFNLSVTQYIEGSASGQESVSTNNQALTWQHDWRHNLTSLLAYTHLDEEFQQSNREDETNTLNVNLTYQLRTWLKLGASYEFIDKSSSINNLAYDKNIYGLTSQFIF
jgi:hypothetical protein